MVVFLRTALSRLAGLFGGERFAIEVDDEIRAHLALLTERLVRQGMTPEEARCAALRQFGGVTPLKEELRERRGWPQLEATWQDARYAFRQLRKSPGFTLAAVLTLALGIGANSTVFTIVNTAFLHPLPVEGPEQLVSFNRGRGVNLSYPDYREFRDRNDVLAGVMACRFMPVSLSISSGSNFRVWTYEATGNCFDLLGVKPFLGRRDQLAYPLFPARVAAVALGVFGFIAVVLAATGVFALVAYGVARRTREIGTRMALGADARQVLGTVLARTGLLSLVGAGAGTAIAMAGGKSLSAVLYGVSPDDPRTYAIALALMMAICVLSCWLPARRAVRIDPSRSLREE